MNTTFICNTDLLTAVRVFWDGRPCNILHSPRPLGSRSYFDEVAARKYFVEPHISLFADFPSWHGKKVLEIGCGIGTDTIDFAKNGAVVTAVDISEKSISIARQRARIYGLDDRIKFYCGNAEELSEFVPVELYDLVYSWGVIHHTPHPERIVEQIHRFVHPGSTVKVMVYHRYSWKVFWIVLTYWKTALCSVGKLVSRYSEANTGCPVTRIYSLAEARKLLKGFKILNLKVEHIFPYKISEYVQYRYVRVWYIRYIPQWLFRWLETHFGWHLCITAMPASSSMTETQ